MLSEIQLRLVHGVVLFLLAAITSLEQHGLALLLCRYLVDGEHVRLLSRRLRSVRGVRAADSGLVDTRARYSRLLLRQRVLMLERLVARFVANNTGGNRFLLHEYAVDQVFSVTQTFSNFISAMNRLIVQLITVAILRSPF